MTLNLNILSIIHWRGFVIRAMFSSYRHTAFISGPHARASRLRYKKDAETSSFRGSGVGEDLVGADLQSVPGPEKEQRKNLQVYKYFAGFIPWGSIYPRTSRDPGRQIVRSSSQGF